jgi:2-methylcitrate dehydratase PrpD
VPISEQAGEEHGVGGYLVALTDWLACACGGVGERAARAVRASGDDLLTDVAFAATAGHVLDFDDTFSEGVAHVSATCAPAALVLGARLGLSLGAALQAYAEGFEAMAALAAASHPALYDGGWHPTSVCGPVGAAVSASSLLDLPAAQRENAVALALLRAGGTRGAFGSDAKAIQVGLAAAAGVQAALLARGGASVDPRAIHGPLGFEAVLGAAWPEAGAGDARAGCERAIEGNWIKLYPSCLATHAPIEAATHARDRGYRPSQEQLDVTVSPLARQAAHLDVVGDGLSAKFSIQYCVSHTLTHGPPRVRDFAAIDGAVRDRSRLVRVSVDDALPEFGAVLALAGSELARVPCPRGAPERPVSASELARKVQNLAGDHLHGVLDDLRAPAARALQAAGVQPRVRAATSSGRA